MYILISSTMYNKLYSVGYTYSRYETLIILDNTPKSFN